MSGQTAAVRPAAGPRMLWMDTLRGIAIVLVLLWHAPAIPALLGFEIPPAIRAVNEFFLPYRMPMLMFLSGMLLPRSLSKPLGSYYIGKFQMIAWPYAIWALLHMLSYEATAPLYSPRAWIATGYLWFIFFILCYYLIAPALKWLPPVVTPLLAFALAIPAPEGLATRMLYFAGFFFAGNFAARNAERFLALVGNRIVVGVCAVAACAFGVTATLFDTQYNALFAPLSLAGIVAAIALIRRVDGQRWTAPLRFIGRSSLVYYVAHFPIMHLALLVLMAWGVSNVAVIAPVLLVVALVFCTLLARVKDRVPIAWLFRAPWPPVANRAPASAR